MFRLIKKVGEKLESKKETPLKPVIFKNEDEMQNWIADNLGELLPSLCFLSREHFIGKNYLDILALNPKQNAFVIIECKLKGLAWEKYYSTKKEYEALGSDYYSLKKTKIILISPHFEDWVIELAKEIKNENIILAKMGAYELKGDYYLYVDIEGKWYKELVSTKNREELEEYPEPGKWEKWAKDEVKALEKINPALTSKEWRGNLDIKMGKITILTIYVKSNYPKSLKQPKLFLVGSSSLLRNKWNITNLVDIRDNTYEFLIDIKKKNGFQEAHSLLLEFIKEKS